MRPAGPIARWLRFVGLTRDGYRPGVVRRTPQQARAAQAVVARQAFLSTLTPHQQTLAGPTFGDTQ